MSNEDDIDVLLCQEASTQVFCRIPVSIKKLLNVNLGISRSNNNLLFFFHLFTYFLLLFWGVRIFVLLFVLFEIMTT